jgi:copper(I)-binding protein
MVKNWKALFFFLCMVTACRGGAGEMKVVDAWSRPGLHQGNSGVFFVIENATPGDDTLLYADSEVASAVEIHRTVQEGEVMKMVFQESVPVPARSQVEFKPGDLHVMLIGLVRDLAPGDTFNLTLHFAQAGDILLAVEVK